MPTTIGVLAIQGGFSLHKNHIEALSSRYLAVEKVSQLNDIDGLILPGGESGAMLRLLEHLHFQDPLSKFLKQKPSWGICAGAILLAKKVTNPVQKSYGAISMTIERNGYGRQNESSIQVLNNYEVSFIRAPIISSVSSTTKILASLENSPVWVEEDLSMATTFHAETNLNTPSPWHSYFFQKIQQKKTPKS